MIRDLRLDGSFNTISFLLKFRWIGTSDILIFMKLIATCEAHDVNFDLGATSISLRFYSPRVIQADNCERSVKYLEE